MAPREIYSDGNFRPTVGLKYFDNREISFISAEGWLERRRKDDDIGNLWRVHDGLYDLETFVRKHPGGSEWLELTKGTDITEAFETHHWKDVHPTLQKFFVRKATTPRLSIFTFYDSGFYRTLKRKIENELPKLPKHVIQRSKVLTDFVVFMYLLLSVMATFSKSFSLGIIAGYLLTLMINASHNYIHQKDNFRMYYLDLSMMSSREFRISHVLSHHLFPNTVLDLEIIMLEPWLHFLPLKKTEIEKKLCWLYAIILFPFLTIGGYFQRVFHQRKIDVHCCIPWIALLLNYSVSGQELLECFKMFIWIICWSSLFFFLIGKTAAHHHPEIFHDGDAPRAKDEMDFGIHQLDAVCDRPYIQGSPFLVLTNFGDHALHHLFPTLDHGVLDYLYPTFLQTCLDYGIEWKMFSSIELLKGAFQQLSKDEPNKNPPPPLKLK